MNLLFVQSTGSDTLLTRWAARIAESLFGDSKRSSSTKSSGASGEFGALVSQAAARHGVPEDLLNAVIKAESNFDPDAVSCAGAKGLMQLMDGTAKSLGVSDSFDPVQNINGGATYLRQMLDRYQSIPLALAAYNAGPGAVDRYGGVPPYAETQTYVQRIMGYCGATWEA